MYILVHVLLIREEGKGGFGGYLVRFEVLFGVDSGEYILNYELYRHNCFSRKFFEIVFCFDLN